MNGMVHMCAVLALLKFECCHSAQEAGKLESELVPTHDQLRLDTALKLNSMV